MYMLHVGDCVFTSGLQKQLRFRCFKIIILIIKIIDIIEFLSIFVSNSLWNSVNFTKMFTKKCLEFIRIFLKTIVLRFIIQVSKSLFSLHIP